MKIRDVLLYCAIAIVVAAVAILIGAYRAKAGLPLGLPVKWLGFAIMTGLAFLNAFRSHSDYWRRVADSFLGFRCCDFADGRIAPHRNSPEPFTLREGAAGFGF